MELVPHPSAPSPSTAPPPAPIAIPESRELFRLVFVQMRRLAGPHRDFDDLVQKGMIELYGALPRFRGESSFNTFAAAVCYRVWAKHLRWTTRWLRRFTLSGDGQLPERTDTRMLAGEQLELRERGKHLYGALEQLSEKRRAVIILHDLQGLELEEIAVIVGCGVTTVRTRLRDARRALAGLLKGDPYFAVEEEPA